MITARKIVYNCLIKMTKQNAYSNLILDDALTKCDLSSQDRKFASALFYGVIEHSMTLDILIEKYSSRKFDKLSVEVREILRMGFYQLLYMDSVPESAAVNECVNLAKGLKNQALSGYVNGVLRSFIRDGKNLPKGKDEIEDLSIKYSTPVWLIEKISNDYGYQNAKTMARTSVGRPPLTIRVNTTKITADELVLELKKEEIDTTISEIIDNCLIIENGGAIEKSECYKKGYFHVQDISSQIACQALSPKPEEIVIDFCSAPGGKSFTMAEIMENKGQLLAFDLHEKRVRLICMGAKRLGLNIIKGKPNNAKEFNEKIPMADKILCDVPCSGLGVIRRKPEIKYKNPDDFAGLPKVQLEILTMSSKYLKVGGELVYSTCTLSRAENDEVIDKFLEENKDFEKCEEVTPLFSKGYKETIFPDMYNSDGFFIAKIIKTR